LWAALLGPGWCCGLWASGGELHGGRRRPNCAACMRRRTSASHATTRGRRCLARPAHTRHAPREVRKCEKPIYTVVRPLGSRRSWWDGKSPAELRQYAPMLVAQVAGQCCAAAAAVVRLLSALRHGSCGSSTSSSRLSQSGTPRAHALHVLPAPAVPRPAVVPLLAAAATPAAEHECAIWVCARPLCLLTRVDLDLPAVRCSERHHAGGLQCRLP
jgi:hypothetical protein